MADRNVVANLRIKELVRVLRWRYKYGLPDDDAGRADAQIMADHFAHWPDGHERFVHFAEVWAAEWFDADELLKMYEAARMAPRRWTAAALGKELNLSFEERTELGIRTIAAANISQDEIDELRRRRKNEVQRERRRQKQERETRIRPAASGPLTPRQQSIVDALRRGPAWRTTADLKEAIGGLPSWRDKIGQPLRPDSFRRVLNREMDELVRQGAVIEGGKQPTKFGTETRTFSIKRAATQRDATLDLSRDARTTDGEEAA